MLQESFETSVLYDFYGPLLSEKQQRFVELYHLENCSLTEIAEAVGVSKQAVSEGLKRAEKALANYEDKLGLDKIYIQAKKYKADNTVGKPQIQQFAGALDEQKATKGVFITTSDYSKEARNYVEKLSKKIVLINGQELTRFMIEFNVGVSTKKTYDVKKIDSDYFEE